MKKMKLLIATLFICMICIIPSMNAQASGWDRMDLTAKANSQTKVTISWKEKAKLYKVYRAYAPKEAGKEKWTKIATLSSSKRSYVDKKAKKNKKYRYMVKAYNKSGSSYKLVYKGDTSVNTGLYAPVWDDYALSDYSLSPTQITLAFCEENGIKAAGFKIYRRKSGTKSYKKIATVKAKSNKYLYTYTDKTVEKGATYYYKVKSYYKKGKKTVNSASSEKIKLAAVNRRGSYKTTLITKPQNDITELNFKITSSAYNADLVIKSIDWFGFGPDADISGYDSYDILIPTKYSRDGKTWIDITSSKDLVLKGNQTIILKLKTKDGKKIPYLDLYNAGLNRIGLENCKYNSLPSYFYIDVKTNTGLAYPNLTYIH